VLKHAITYPFLLNELLAASALNLSTRRPAQQPLNREEAIRLQSQALRLFNETIRDPNFQNIIAPFLFSALQGIATFFETFHPRRMKRVTGPSSKRSCNLQDFYRVFGPSSLAATGGTFCLHQTSRTFWKKPRLQIWSRAVKTLIDSKLSGFTFCSHPD
jgi:hypothetical protein